MSENIHKQNIIEIIEREIRNTEEEINNINDIVKKDIDALLSENIADVTEEDREEFHRKHFRGLKEQKMESLNIALEKFQALKDDFLIECEECKECKTV